MKIEAIQIGAFFAPNGERVNAMKAFELVLKGVEVEAFNQKAPGQSQARAVHKDHQLAMVALPDRIDLHISGRVDPSSGEEGEIDLDFVRQLCLEEFAPFAAKIEPSRLAFVISGATNVTTLEESVDYFTRVADGIKVPTGTNEVDFKINVPRQSASAAPLMLNALHRWYSATAVMVIIGPGGPATRATQPQLNEQIDINTVIEQLIPAQKVPDLYAEMFALACDQIDKGPSELEVKTDG
jgi:hypothetical protein